MYSDYRLGHLAGLLVWIHWINKSRVQREVRLQRSRGPSGHGRHHKQAHESIKLVSPGIHSHCTMTPAVCSEGRCHRIWSGGLKVCTSGVGFPVSINTPESSPTIPENNSTVLWERSYHGCYHLSPAHKTIIGTQAHASRSLVLWETLPEKNRVPALSPYFPARCLDWSRRQDVVQDPALASLCCRMVNFVPREPHRVISQGKKKK